MFKFCRIFNLELRIANQSANTLKNKTM